MYRGTLYGHWEAIITMQQLIVLADADGIVDMTPQAIAAHTSIPLDIITKGISKLEETDPYSRTPGEDGRRIVLIDEHKPWGWQLVNYQKYKHLKDSDEVREQTRERVKRFREKRNAEKRDVTLGNAEKRYTDTDTDTKKHSAFALPSWVPEEAWKGWLEVRQKIKAPNTVRALTLAVKELDRLRGEGQDPTGVLETATVKGWRSLYPVKQQQTANQSGEDI